MSQYISDFIANRPFGNGITDLTISSSQTQSLITRSCSGASGQKVLTLASVSSITNGDLVLIHQSRGTGAGIWEVNMVSSGGGTASLTMVRNLANTYTDSGASQAQVSKIPMYKDVTLNNGITWTVPEWNGNNGGLFLFAARGTVTINGTIYGVGANGTNNADAGQPGNQGGYRGGAAHENSTGGQGEGTSGDRNTQSTAANGSGGGGSDSAGTAGGGGGGNGASGSTGTGTGTAGTGGGTAGSADLTTLAFGGGGGGGGGVAGTDQGSGANGGNSVIIFAKSIDTSSGAITLTGGTGGQGDSRNGGGGGAGGSCLIKAQTAVLGTTKITAAAGSGQHGGGNGGAGRIRCDYGATVSGSANPALSSAQDGRLFETDPALLFLL